MNDYFLRKSKDLLVAYIGGSKSLFFEVLEEKANFGVSIKLNCECKFWTNQGCITGELCEHQLAVLRKILEGDFKGERISTTETE